jgi:hypothetical protein
MKGDEKHAEEWAPKEILRNEGRAALAWSSVPTRKLLSEELKGGEQLGKKFIHTQPLHLAYRYGTHSQMPVTSVTPVSIRFPV